MTTRLFARRSLMTGLAIGFGAALGLFACVTLTQLLLQASPARAQATGIIEAAGVDAPYGAWVVISRSIHQMDSNGFMTTRPTIPGTSPVIACGTDMVILQNGNVYVWTGGSWELKGSFPGAATGTTRISFGQLKSTYR